MIARTILEARISEVREALRRARLLRHLAAAFAIGILVRGTFLLAALNGHALSKRWDRWSMLGLIVLCLVAWLKGRRNIWSDHEIARVIEQKHPALDSLLLTAIEHEPEADEPTGFLHERLIDHALARAATQNWPVTVANKPYTRALAAAWLAVIAFVAIDVALRLNMPDQKSKVAQQVAETASKPTAFEATLTPGDAEVERGSRLIIEARFNGPVPADAMLIVSEPDGKVRERLPMRLTVDEQVYGGLISKVDADTKYHVEFANQKSKEHTITVFDYPALVRADVIVMPPEYTKLPSKETKNTQKVTALEGSKIAWKIKVNKPLIDTPPTPEPASVASDPFAKPAAKPSLQATTKPASPVGPHLTAAELFGEDKSIITLTPSSEDPTVLEGVFTAEKSQKYRLHLVDEADRANKNPPWFKVTVQSNQLAKIEVVFPKRDLQVSSIQELPVEAKVSDDLGVTKSGAVFSINGNSKEILFKHPITEPLKKQDVRAELTLEKENAQPRQLVSYYLWAEDTGPKGEVRRAMSDMFFADVRHFEDIFREMEAPPSEPGEPGKKAESDKLVELQKQIVNATWRIIRDTNAGRVMEAAAPDVDVVHQSQGLALEQTKEAMEKVEDAEAKNALTEAWKSMKDALDPLQQASEEKKRSPLNQALTYEQSALEWLHRAQSREHQVMRQNQPSKSMSGSESQKQNQLMDLEMKQKEQRYEEEKAATEEQTAEQQENLQVLNRLKELARRQEALAEKMKELQNQIAQAKTEEEKEELDNQLKRLQAEQEQLLRDLDDLKDRMEKPENAQNMAEAKEQLDQTREKVMEAAEQLKEEKLADAANSATRAQRELEKMQEDFRQKTSKKFAEEVKQLRQQAREAAETQKKISEALENQKPADSDIAQSLQNQAQARQVTEQQENVEKLLNSMRELSEQAEQSEPLLHRNLYDAVRKAQTSGLEENLQETRDQLRYGSQAEAKEAERKAANAVDELQKGVEKAAESVLGSESEALRVAKNELDKLIKEAQEQEGGEKGQEGQKGPQQASAKSDKSDSSDKSDPKGQKPGKKGEGEAQDAKSADKGQQPGKDGDPNGKGQGEPQDPKMAQSGQKPGEGQEGQKPGEQGQDQPQDPKTAQNGKQPGEGKDGQQLGEKGEGQGQKPGEKGQGQGEGQDPKMAEAGQQPGEGQKGQGQGQKPGEQQGKGQGQGQQPGQQGQGQQQANANSPEGQKPGEGQGQQPGQGRGEGRQQTADANQPRNGQSRPGDNRGGNNTPDQFAGGRTTDRDSDNDRFRPQIVGGSVPEALFFEDSKEETDKGVFTGNGYDQWSDRLRNVEELLNNPELRNEAAKVLDRARELRINLKRSNEAPQVAVLNQRITQPLIELRDRVVEELSKKDAGKNLAPVDRDPVPAEFRELVKRYYKELGAGK
ncbi:DUF4175 family protein [Prosthecobacter sp.]|uniref:DUF4175 family protein n=1 Tax=Prosthecobacter sp. TaxID=1965333 RepID=UPI001DDA353B|nr:DUF4175 family protein [Prosthecobacter sp.]MCB1276656.1 hypothetical protein [Prosthecobacter sp.]